MSASQTLQERYQAVRHFSEQLCKPLQTDDYQIQSCLETSPPKWHLAHVSWFFETFLLRKQLADYRVFHPQFEVLFNSYYETVGEFHPRPKRGLLARPTVEEVYAYRHAIDDAMQQLFAQLEQQPNPELAFFIELGLNHEQQHQELLLMDIKHNFSGNPLKPAYRSDLKQASSNTPTAHLQWFEQEAGIYEVGHDSAAGFAYDNESPRHKQYLHDFQLANRLVTNAEYLAFMADGAYQRPELWLAEGWHHIHHKQKQQPLYWQKDGEQWLEFTLGGLRPLQFDQPVCHINYYEADAFARWSGKRLPTEFELEVVQAQQPLHGNFVDHDYLHPQATQTHSSSQQAQWFGDLWTWTSTAYHAYHGFKPLAGAAGEYNGKFMCKQMVLRGGSCVTSQNHMRVSYRNFFYPHDRWQFSGIRLAADA